MQQKKQNKLLISSAFEALEIVGNEPGNYRVLSIMNPGSSIGFAHAKEVLYLEFHDITLEDVSSSDSSSQVLATKHHCQQALEFLDKQGDCLIHCAAGKRRSTAIALGHLLRTYTHETAVDELFKIRPIADPNLHVLNIMCEILNKTEDDYLDLLACIAFKKLNSTN